MRINMLMMVAIVILGVTILSYLLRVLAMIELWQISIALLAVSFGAWFEVHSKYSEDARKLKRERLDKVRKKIEEICEQRQKGDKEEKMESEMASLTKLYEESNEPIDLCEQTWSIFSYAGVCFLASIFCRLGVDLLSISQLSPIEGLIFFFGMIARALGR